MIRTLTIVAAFSVVVALVAAMAACSNGSDVEATSPTPTPTSPVEVPVEDVSSAGSDGASSGENSSEDGGGNGEKDENDNGNGGNGNGGGSAAPSSEDDVAAFTNPNPDGNGITLNSAQNEALKDAKPRDMVAWNTQPTLSMWELRAEGTIQKLGVLFDPLEGDGSAFSVYYKGHAESLVELLPELEPTMMWLTDLTVAPTEVETKGDEFSFRAYSPLFMDTDPSDLELRVYGYDADGNPAILAIAEIVAE